MATRSKSEGEELVEIVGDLDEHVIEAIRLEVRALARRHGLTVRELGLEKGEPSA